jgi:hypothetical protein
VLGPAVVPSQLMPSGFVQAFTANMTITPNTTSSVAIAMAAGAQFLVRGSSDGVAQAGRLLSGQSPRSLTSTMR